jgi:hypothetical protein
MVRASRAVSQATARDDPTPDTVHRHNATTEEMIPTPITVIHPYCSLFDARRKETLTRSLRVRVGLSPSSWWRAEVPYTLISAYKYRLLYWIKTASISNSLLHFGA